MARTFVLHPSGGFSLRAAAGFGFGPTEGRPPPFDGCMRLAFALDGGSGYAGVVLRQPGDTLDADVTVELHTTSGADASAAVAQAARIVSLDHDGEEFVRAGERDPVIGKLQRAHPGQRPVLFHSPYEAAAWAIISARRPSRQAAVVRAAIAERLGRRFELAGRTLDAFPQPDRLRGAPDPTPGLNTEKVERLRALAATALHRCARGGAGCRGSAPSGPSRRLSGSKGSGRSTPRWSSLRGTRFRRRPAARRRAAGCSPTRRGCTASVAEPRGLSEIAESVDARSGPGRRS